MEPAQTEETNQSQPHTSNQDTPKSNSHQENLHDIPERERSDSIKKVSALARKRSSVSEKLIRRQSSASHASDSTTMQAAFVTKIGGPLRVARLVIPKPGPNEVLIKVEAAPINPSDIQFLNGHHVHLHPPFQIGLEGSGTVMSSGGGSAANGLVNKRVSFGAMPTKPGSWGEYIVTQAQNCFVLDDSVSFEKGSCGIINPLTAIAFLETFKKEKHKTIVRTAAASQLGRMMSRLLKKEGIRTIDIVRKAEHKKILEDLGSAVVLCSEEEDFEENLKKAAEEMNATCLLECVCGSNTNKVLKAMPKNSICYIYGHLAEGELTKIDFADLLSNNKTIKPFTFVNWFSAQGMFSKMKTIWKLQKSLLSDLKTDIAKVFTIDEVNEALKYYTENMTEGKVIIKPQTHLEHHSSVEHHDAHQSSFAPKNSGEGQEATH